MIGRPSTLLLFVLCFFPAGGLGQLTPAQTRDFVRRSAQVQQTNWKHAPEFDFCETDKTKDGTRTSAVFMIEGSPYYRLVQLNGQDLPPAQESQEKARLAAARQKRARESQQEKAKRVAQYQKERQQDQQLLAQLTQAMRFTFVDSETAGAHSVYMFDATPRPSYDPPSMETQVLTGMKGRLWIEQSSAQWVKVEAQVVQPVSIAGFLARVEPGTRFGLEVSPVTPEIWLPHHYTMQSRARIVFLFNKVSQDDETYFHYVPNGKLTADACRSKNAEAQP
ncbi:MAG TPA: hypothetical protein VGR96_00015 [Acidobacteriaceae bacterium]|nr:hypothetical protein [Acidobacteriaceae bacterium]